MSQSRFHLKPFASLLPVHVMLVRLWVAGLLTLASVAPAVAAPAANSSVAEQGSSSRILAVLAAKPLVRSEFVQLKTLPSLSKPLQASGSMLFSKQQGVLWRLQKPVPADLVVTSSKMLQKTARTQSELSLARSPYGSAATLLLQLMSGNEAAVKQAFNVQNVQWQGDSWRIQLVPKQPQLQKMFSDIVAEGDQYVRHIVMTENAGGQTDIRFNSPTDQPVQLSTAEYALFQLAK